MNEATPGRRITVECDVPCTVRDGTVLRADVYRPEEGRSPVLVHRTPYGKDHPMGVTNLMLQPLVAAARGYAVVVQDVRGRFASDGSWTPLHCEADDGFDTVEWAAAQPWSSGRVGIYGSSYMGVTTLQAVAAGPPHLQAAAAYLTGGNYQDGWVYSGGAFELLFNLRWAAGQALAEVDRAELDHAARRQARDRLRWIAEKPHEAMRFTPLEDVFGAADPLVPYWREWMTHDTYDPYWEAVDLTKRLTRLSVPLLNITGWYDGFLKGHLDVCAAAEEAAGSGVTHHEMWLGPWDHESYQGMRPNAAGDAFFGLEAMSGAAGLSGPILDWFDRWLVDTPNDDEHVSGDRIRYFHMGPNEWRTAASWPPADPAAVRYLGSGGHANSRHGNGRLTREPASGEAVDSYVHDPQNPIPTRGGRHLGYWYGRAGVQDQADIELRPDVLVYTGEHLADPLDVIGMVRVWLYVRSSAASTDFTAKLVDVRPDGYCANVAEGITRVPPDSGLREAAPRLITVDLWQTSYRFAAGHRIRLEVASSNFPRFDINGNLPTRPSATAAREWSVAAQQVWSGSRYPSAIQLGGTASTSPPGVPGERPRVMEGEA